VKEGEGEAEGIREERGDWKGVEMKAGFLFVKRQMTKP
jgi:hypothetical protein